MIRTLRPSPPEFAGLILTYRCTCACRHCLYACSPRWERWVEASVLRDSVAALAALPRPPSVHLAGGEAFLDPDRLLEAVGVVVEAGLEIDFIETNGAWYDDQDEAADLLRRLADAGASRLLVSATPFHAESVAPRKVVELLQLAQGVLGEDNAWPWTPSLLQQLLAIDPMGTVSYRRYLEQAGVESARWALLSGFPMTLAGRAAHRLGPLVPNRPASTLVGQGNCRDALLHTGHLHGDPEGNAIPGYCSGFSLGDVRQQASIAAAGLPAADYPVTARLVEEGLAGLLAHAEQEAGFVPDPAGYRGACHLCQVIRGHLLSRGVGERELRPRRFYEELDLLD